MSNICGIHTTQENFGETSEQSMRLPMKFKRELSKSSGKNGGTVTIPKTFSGNNKLTFDIVVK